MALLNDVIDQNTRLNTLLSNGRVFTGFNYETDIIENQKEIVTSPLFSDEVPELLTLHTASYQTTNQRKYYYDVVRLSSSLENEFSITYGNVDGNGSEIGSPQTIYPSKAIYKQYKQILLDAGTDLFKFNNAITSEHIYVLNFKRERFKQRLDPGNWQISLAELNGGGFINSVYTGSNVAVSGSNKLITLIDDSGDSNEYVSSLTDTGRVYNIVSGSISNGVYTASTQSYGLVYPEHGVIVLNANVLNTELSFNTVTGSNANGDNAYKLFTSLSGSAVIKTGSAIEGRASEIITSTYYYARLKNTEYNFSTNPSFTTGSLGDIKHLTMIQDPKVFITTIGLYNDSQELLAVGKLSTPILKSFSTEANIKVKIDW